MPKSPAERRKYPRHETRLAIRFRDRRNLKGEYISNISYGGVFVCTTDPLPTGSKLDLMLEGPGGERLSVQGVVVWSSLDATEAVDPDSKNTGMGIRFGDSQEQIDQVKAFMASLDPTKA